MNTMDRAEKAFDIERFGGTGRWRPLFAPELAISELMDAHLVNAVLWIDKQLAGLLSKAVESPASLAYLVRKSKELRDECGKRRLCVPVGTEPPSPMDHEFSPQKQVEVNAYVVGSQWASTLIQKEISNLPPNAPLPVSKVMEIGNLPCNQIFAMRDGDEYRLQYRIAPDAVHDIVATMDRKSAVALRDAMDHILSEGN